MCGIEVTKEVKGEKIIFKNILANIYPNLMNTINPHIKQAQQTPSIKNMKKITQRYIVIKLLKTNEKH